MAKKKTSSLLSNGLVQNLKPIETVASNIPPYEDIGVKYQPYAKEFRGGFYSLLPQQAFYDFELILAGGGTATIATGSANKPVFITNMIISSSYIVPAGSDFQYYLELNGNRIGHYDNAQNQPLYIEFNPPLKVDGTLQLLTGSAQPAGTATFISFCGFKII